MKLIELLKDYSQEALVEKLITAEDLKTRDTIKGQLLAYSDFETISKAFEEKDLAKLKTYLEAFDVYQDNLNLFINVTEPRQELVLLSKIETLKVFKQLLLDYVQRTIESTPTEGVHSTEVEEDKGTEGTPVKG